MEREDTFAADLDRQKGIALSLPHETLAVLYVAMVNAFAASDPIGYELFALDVMAILDRRASELDKAEAVNATA